MSNGCLRTGSNSIIIGKNHYCKFLPIKKSKLLKITKISENHNEFTNLHIVRTIDNYKKYYSIPEETCYLLNPSHQFYEYIQNLVCLRKINIFGGTLQCYFIEFAGDKDLLKSIADLHDNAPCSYWKSYKQILRFINKMLLAIMYLHENKLCHLDIKPENIVVNTTLKKYKLIDFGFASKEPFDDYIQNLRGTSKYFPKQIEYNDNTPWFPKIKANDLDGNIPMQTNRKLVYKVDSYCLGRVLYLLKYIFKENRSCYCYNYELKREIKIDNIISDLLENDVLIRMTVTEILNKYYKKN